MSWKKILKGPSIKMQINGPNVSGSMELNLKRFEKQFEKAQYELDSMVMTSMVPFMPFVTETFISETKSKSGSIAGTGIVYAAVPPHGRFLYEGKTMVDEKTGSTYARKGTKKVLVSQFGGKTNAKEDLQYNKEHNPKAQSHWFDAAKKQDLPKWVKKTKEIAGGGVNVGIGETGGD